MREVFGSSPAQGREDCMVVFGESGRARAGRPCVHECSARCDKPFIAVNCGAIPKASLKILRLQERRLRARWPTARAASTGPTADTFLDDSGS
ncbi:MAG: sigma 54-interacting transcriptional regulator [Bilophila wadsworthia]